jgi:hypothetical protein
MVPTIAAKLADFETFVAIQCGFAVNGSKLLTGLLTGHLSAPILRRLSGGESWLKSAVFATR